jgi:hypothetical protein
MSGLGAVASSNAVDPIRSGDTGAAAYLQDLSRRFPNLQIRKGTVTPNMMEDGEAKPEDIPPHGPGNGNVFIDSRYLQKMMKDPEEAKKAEALLNSIPEAERELERNTQQIAQQIQAQTPGSTVEAKVLDHGFIIDKDGNMGAWSTTMVHGSSPGASETGKGSLLSNIDSKDKKKTKKKGAAAKSLMERMQKQLEGALANKPAAANAATGSPLNILA